MKAECQPRFCGWEDKECWGDYWKNTEQLKRLIEQFTINSILHQRVINSKIKLFWLKLFSNKKPKRSRPRSWRLNRKPEDRRTKKEEKREQTDRNAYDQLFKQISFEMNLIAWFLTESFFIRASFCLIILSLVIIAFAEQTHINSSRNQQQYQWMHNICLIQYLLPFPFWEKIFLQCFK